MLLDLGSMVSFLKIRQGIREEDFYIMKACTRDLVFCFAGHDFQVERGWLFIALFHCHYKENSRASYMDISLDFSYTRRISQIFSRTFQTIYPTIFFSKHLEHTRAFWKLDHYFNICVLIEEKANDKRDLKTYLYLGYRRKIKLSLDIKYQLLISTFPT